ncbi:MAG: hypothetical protein HY057_06055 [Rhodospirillales bacterium]|nr:hypothetical protein [Rhodospirillales bacterium]
MALGLIGLAAILTFGWVTPAAAQGTPRAGQPGAASGNNQQDRDSNRAPSLAEQVPETAIIGALAGTPAGMELVTRFINAGGANSQEITRRAVALLQVLRERAGEFNPEAMRNAAGRIYDRAAQSANSVQIARLAVERNYQPPPGSVALDFGPPDSRLAAGFQKVTPGDERVEGAGLRALNRPSDCEVCAAGIVGVERVKVPVTGNGPFRVILMTDNIGERDVALTPFGNEVVINGISHQIAENPPDQWAQQAYLATNNAYSARGGSAPDGSDTQQPRGLDSYLISAPPPRSSLYGETTAGGVVFEVDRAENGFVTIELRQSVRRDDRRSYLTGLIIEPTETPSSFGVTTDSIRAVASLDSALTQTSALALAVANLIEAVATEAGRQPDNNLPDAVIAQPNPVSPS